MRRLLLLLIAVTGTLGPACGFFGDGADVCDDLCAFERCVVGPDCSEEEFKEPCLDACKEPARGLSDRDTKLIRECLKCVGELFGDDCEVNNPADYNDCENECSTSSVENAGQQLFEDFANNLDDANLECMQYTYYD